jgi:putative ABC transport system ATP-binding protein
MLSLNHLSYTLRTPSESRVLADGIDVTFMPGEIAAITGPSGSGKSTLLSLASGLLAPERGAVSFAGSPLPQDETACAAVRLKSFGYVFQDIRLIHQLNVFDNIAIPAGFALGSVAAGKAAAQRIYATLGVTVPPAAMPSTLSGGERQLIALARALAASPAAIFADEPTAALDWKRGQHFLSALRAQTITHKTVTLIVTHDNRVLDYVDHIYQLENGKLTRVAG